MKELAIFILVNVEVCGGLRPPHSTMSYLNGIIEVVTIFTYGKYGNKKWRKCSRGGSLLQTGNDRDID